VKTITITITEELDAAAAAEAERRGLSKSALIREALTSILSEPLSNGHPTPWVALAGFGAPGLQVVEGEIDETVYRP
jgi:hypothetical protein